MKIFSTILIILFIPNVLFGMEIDVIGITNDLAFDYFFSIFINILWYVAPMFAGLALFSSTR